MSFYSQCGEDAWIAANLPPVKTFCEVGAYDGVLSSNTKHFEDAGARGVLVEADPFLAARCQVNRKEPTWCCAAGTASWAWFNINTADRGLSGLKRPGDMRIPVPIVSLHLILSAHELWDLDLLSIDTEGTELDVWASIYHFRPRIVVMEYQTCQEPPQDATITRHLCADGYLPVHQTHYNLIFTR